MLLYELLSDDLRPKLSKKLQADIKEAIYWKKFSWNQFMSLLFIFNFNDRTSSMAEALGLFPDILKKRIKKGIISVYV